MIVNPVCPAADDALASVAAVCKRRHWAAPLVLPTTTEQPGADQTREALAAGVDRVLVAGGDGTVRQVAGVMPTVPIGIVPTGTANIVARNLGLPRHVLDRAVDIALLGQPRAISIGWVKCQVDGVWGDEMPMLAVAGIGRDAQAVAKTTPWLKSHLGWLAYAWSGGQAAFEDALPMAVSLDGEESVDIEAWSVLAAALPSLPLRVVAFPNVAPGDSAFEVLQVALRQPRDWWSVAVKGIFRTERVVTALHYRRASQVLVRPREPSPVQIDGDLITGVQQMSVRLEPGALSVATPKRLPSTRRRH